MQSIDDKQSRRSSARRLVPASQGGASNASLVHSDLDRLSKTSQGLRGIANLVTDQQTLPKITNRSNSKLSQGGGPVTGPTRSQHHNAQIKSGRGSSARMSQRRPSQTPKTGNQGVKKSYQLTEMVAEQQAKQIMGLSGKMGSSRRHAEQEASIQSHSSKGIGVKSQLEKEVGAMSRASRDQGNDFLNKLTTEDVSLAKGYQTQPNGQSVNQTKRQPSGNIQFHPQPVESAMSKFKGTDALNTDFPSRNSSHRSQANDRQTMMPKVNAWEHVEVNQFKVRNQEPGQIIQKLKLLTASDIPFQGELPPDDDMDSTDPLDSFMYAFVKVVNEKSINWTNEVRRGIHLATHTRTDFCEKMLTFVCHHQKLEQAFRDCVDFFMESLTNLVRLEDENKRMNAEIESLLNMKEDSIVVKFKLQQRLKEQLNNSEKIQKREHQANAKIVQLQKMLSDKNAECQSLQYRLQHMVEVGNGDLQPVSSTRQGMGAGAVPDTADEDNNKQKNGSTDVRPSISHTLGLNESMNVRELQLQNQRLEEEIESLKDALTKQDHSNHFKKIQSLFNKIQIENKNLRIYNQKCESKLESRQTLITHLEDKLSNEIGKYKEKIVALEADIKVLTNKNNNNEEKNQQLMQAQRQKLLSEFKQENDEKIKELEAVVLDNEKQKKDLRNRLDRILREHDELINEFRHFRSEKEVQEAERNQLYEDLEKKIGHQQQVDHDKINQLNKQIDEQENKNEVLEKENAILLLRQKYLKQHTEMLHKQKLFLESTLVRGKGEIWENLKIIEKKILEDNNNENFLISIRKCFEYANQVAGMGSNVLDNISQILGFLKIEKLNSLLSESHEIEVLEQNFQKQIEKSRENQSVQSIIGKISASKKQEPHGQPQYPDREMIQRQLSQIGAVSTDPSPPHQILKMPGGSSGIQGQVSQGIGYQINQKRDDTGTDRNELYYVRNYPVELAYACLKLYIENLINQKLFKSAQEIPEGLYQLFQQAQQLANSEIEQEISAKFFSESAFILSKQITQNLSQSPKMDIITPSLKNIGVQQADSKLSSSVQFVEKEQILQHATQTESSKVPQEKSQGTQDLPEQPHKPILSQSPSDQLGKRNQIQPYVSSGGAYSSDEKNADGQVISKAYDRSTPRVGTSFTKSGDFGHTRQNTGELDNVADQDQLQFIIDKQKLEIEAHLNTISQVKLSSKTMQLNLAGKIVILEEQIERMNTEKDEQIKQLEQAHTEELKVAVQGVEQREAQLLQLCEEYREEARELQWKLDTQWRPEQESKTIQKMEQGTRGNLYKLMKDQYESKFKESQDLLQSYQASINEFVYLREDLRGSFTLAFDCAKLPSGVLNMINESLLRYYLSKTFLMDKSKFRFLRSEELVETALKHKNNEQVQDNKKKPQSILKLIVEVIAQDSVKISQLFKEVKAQIKDGTSLLYDFMPLYFGMNLGSSGFSTHHNLGEFALLSKTGQNIEGVDYIVSVLRHKKNPLIFKVIAFNLERREEYMMELNESDVYELVEGDQQILRNVEPDELIQKITNNLNLIERDNIKVLSCDQKIFFNEIWADRMESAKNHQVHKRSPMESQWQVDRSAAELMQKVQLTQSSLTHTAARTNQLSTLDPRHSENPRDFVEQFYDSKESQTDFPIADLYEGYENVFRGVQKVGEVTHMRLFIKQSTKTSTLIFEIDDLTSLKKLKFSLYAKDSDDHYVIHTECMKITEGHHVLVSIEQIQKEGLMIRMFDLADCKAVSFSLHRKQNGQYSRHPDDTQIDILLNQDFRNFLYELQLNVNKQANENIISNYQYLFRQEVDQAKKSARTLERENEQKKQVESKKRDSLVNKFTATKSLPRRKRALQAQKLLSFSTRAFYKDKWSFRLENDDQEKLVSESPTSLNSQVIDSKNNAGDWRDIPGEKGILLYRNVLYIRWVTNGSDPEPKQSVITLYIRDNQVQMEVLLYQDPAKMSIGSEINAITLFGEDPLQIPFKDRTTILNSMMEKFFIQNVDSVFHMKVESDQIPIQQFMAELEESKKVKVRGDGKAAQGIDTMFHQVQDMPDQKKGRDDEQQKYRRLANVGGIFYNVDIHFRKKQKGKTERTGKHAAKKSSFGKSGLEKAQADIEQYMDDFCAWDSIYFEVLDPNQEKITALYDKKKIALTLAKDEFLDWRAALSNYDPILLNYIQESIQLDKEREELTIYNRSNIQQKVFEKYKKTVGGRYFQRKDLDLTEDEKSIINKVIICNLEIEFSEFLYDIKIFELQRIVDKDIISYQIEIFMLHEPEIVFLFTYPMNSSHQIQDPHTLVIEEFNLIDNGLKKSLEIDKRNKAAQKKGPNVVTNRKHSQNTMDHHGTSGTAGRGQDSTTKAEMEQARLLQKSINRKQDIQRQLFRKYIDNRVILLVQEQRFPRKLDFILVEPCSQLAWRHQIEPRLITTGLSSMHIVDQATLENFLSVMIDEVKAPEPASAKVFEYESVAEDEQSLQVMRPKSHLLQPEGTLQTVSITNNFQWMQNEDAWLVKDKVILENDFKMSVFKINDSISVVIEKLVMNESLMTGAHELTMGQVQGERELNQVALRFRPLEGNTMISRIIRVKGLNYSLLFVRVIGPHTFVKILELKVSSIVTVFKLHFHHDEKMGQVITNQGDESERSDQERLRQSQLSDKQIFTSRDTQRAILDAIRRFYGSQFIEQGMRVFEKQKELIEIENDEEYEEPTIFEQMEDQLPSIHATRTATRQLFNEDGRTIILHRRAYFDEQLEKLIIMQIRLKLDSQEYQTYRLNQEMHSFQIVLQEPESMHEVEFLIPIQECLTQEEIFIDQQHLKEVSVLRRFAKKVLEDRVLINRIENQESLVGTIEENSPEDKMVEELNQDLQALEEEEMPERDGGRKANIFKNYRIDINFEKQQQQPMNGIPSSLNQNRPGLPTLGFIDPRLNGMTSSSPNYTEMTPAFFDETGILMNESAVGSNGIHPGQPMPNSQQILQQQAELDPAFQQQPGSLQVAQAAFQQREHVSAMTGGAYGNNQSTILEEAASNEEDLDQAGAH